MSANRAVDDAYERLLGVLSKYVSEISARAAVNRAVHVRGLLHPPSSSDLPALFKAVEAGVALLLDRKKQSLLHGELEFELARLVPAEKVASPDCQTIEVRSEWDISLARARSREFVTALGGKSTDVVKVMTIVSELARNLVLYTPGGRVVFSPLREPPPSRLVVRAIDEGPGIADVDAVLSGRYRSKTGLGRGLLGVQRLANHFELQTDANGTCVEAEVRFG